MATPIAAAAAPTDSGQVPIGWHGHSHVVWPSISAGRMALVARLGDWTWQRVCHTYGLDVLAARTATGAPAYLSFHYCRYRATPQFHLGSPTFGDQLEVSSAVLGAGPQSTIAVHRLRRDGPMPQITPEEFLTPVASGELRVLHLNRWITPGTEGNLALVRTAPVGFDPDRAPRTPLAAAVRERIRTAREHATFRPEARPAGEPHVLAYTVDAARDLNAVGLLYFACYAGLVDWALWQAWTLQGRDDAAFVSRTVVDQEQLHLGNADAGSRLILVVSPWRADGHDGADVVVSREHDRTVICVSSLTFGPEPTR